MGEYVKLSYEKTYTLYVKPLIGIFELIFNLNEDDWTKTANRICECHKTASDVLVWLRKPNVFENNILIPLFVVKLH